MRKEMKANGRKSLKTHYLLMVAICLAASILGAEFTSSLTVMKNYDVSDEISEGELSTGPLSTNANITNALDEVVSGNPAKAEAITKEATEAEVQATKDGKTNPILGRSRGVLAGLVNAWTSGSILVTFTNAALSVTKNGMSAVTLLILIGVLLQFAFWFLVKNMYTAISRRMFLEARTYENVPIRKFLFFYRVRKWFRVACTMFMMTLYSVLWSLTIIGGIIKHYSYYMVPYIVAENPGLKAKEAITLSRKMMNGHKWECFVFELSYLGWWFLGTLTLGLSEIFYSDPYKVAAFTEYYVYLRQRAIDNKIEGCELLNDKYLYEKAPEDLLVKTYSDVMTAVEEKELNDQHTKALHGIKGFFAKVFGIALGNQKEMDAIHENEETINHNLQDRSALEGRSYPGKLFTIPEHMRREKTKSIHYMRIYSIWSLIMLYFIFSFIGWIWEVSLHLVSDGVFVNRGVLHGPWLPIYGTGGVLILIILNKFRKTPILEFISAIILCGCVEYFTAYSLEMTHNGKKWWDYSGYFLNLDGRICAEGLLVFGLGGMAIVYFLAPLLDNQLRKIKMQVIVPLSLCLVIVFAGDQMYSKKHPNEGKGITDYTGAYFDRHTDDILREVTLCRYLMK